LEAGRAILIERLLKETAAAHGEYETTALGGVYDEDWSGWYAAYLLEHGLHEAFPPARDLGADQLAAILRQLDTDYRREQPGSDWPAYYAARLDAMMT
jgi:hypothetical protein